MQLFATVTTLRAQNVTRHTAGMNAHQYGVVLVPFALDECQVFQSVRLLTEGNQTEMAVIGGHIHLFTHLHKAFLLQAVGNHILDSDDFQVVFLCKCHQLRHTRHGAVVVHNLDEGTGGIETGEFAEVNSCLRMP